jgi:hypothetical protein
VNNEFERIWKEAVVSYSSYYPGIFWSDWGKLWKIIVSDSDDSAKIRIHHFRNTRLGRYIYTNLYGDFGPGIFFVADLSKIRNLFEVIYIITSRLWQNFFPCIGFMAIPSILLWFDISNFIRRRGHTCTYRTCLKHSSNFNNCKNGDGLNCRGYIRGIWIIKWFWRWCITRGIGEFLDYIARYSKRHNFSELGSVSTTDLVPRVR